MRTYMCIDLKSFYASCECHERGLDPLKTNLVVADSSRTEKTICLAVSPSLKQYGLKGRCRLFEVISKVKEINEERRKNNKYKTFTGKSYNSDELKDKSLELDFIIAKPRMSLYIEYSSKIYEVYLKYMDSEDIYVYSIDEVFCDITSYLKLYNLNANLFATRVIKEVLKETGITATAGIGTNLYLAKVSMDILAKHAPPNLYGVRIFESDEATYRKLLWNHTPLTDFWRVGTGYANKLMENKLYTMGDIARTSLNNEELLFKLFGVNAEILIDHAWGYEPLTIKDLKSYKPQNNCLSSGQVLHTPYNYFDTKLIITEMIDNLTLELVKRNLVTNKVFLNINYEKESEYDGPLTKNYYNQFVPKGVNSNINLDHFSSSFTYINQETLKLYERLVNKKLLIRRITITFANLTIPHPEIKQLDLFSKPSNKKREEQETNLQKTILNIKNKYGKNSILKASNLEKNSTMKERNEEIGGHHE